MKAEEQQRTIELKQMLMDAGQWAVHSKVRGNVYLAVVTEWTVLAARGLHVTKEQLHEAIDRVWAWADKEKE